MDALFAFGDLLINPFSIYAARSTIATLLVSLVPSEKSSKDQANGESPLKKSQHLHQVIESRRSFLEKFGDHEYDP